METITTNNNWKKKFIIIWTGQLFSILSSSIAQFSMVLWIGMETGSAEVLSYAAIAGLLPQILLGPMAGVFVDRWNRKWTMIGADSFVALFGSHCSAVLSGYGGTVVYLFVVDAAVDRRCFSCTGNEILDSFVGSAFRAGTYCRDQ